MRILIYFEPKRRNQKIYEGVRVRKSLKGACELNGISYTSDPRESYDIAHFVGVRDEEVINEALLKKAPVIISALMCENDPDAAMLVQKGEVPTLAPRTLRILNRVTLIIVPTEDGRIILKHAGVETPIRVLSEGVNLSRFDPTNELEKQIFLRYYHLEKSRKLVVSVGVYDKEAGLHDLVNIARKRPDSEFYFFGRKKGWFMPRVVRRVLKVAPKNCHFQPIVDDDVYRSALLNANVFFVPSYVKAGTVSFLDAMAAKCQIIARESAVYADMLTNKKEAHICKTTSECEKKLGSFLDGKLESTVDAAYELAQTVDLKKVGMALKDIYDSLYYFGGLS
ncbi:MAG: glycosyltransferase [Firmicutes bacterium]|nr:glycosyltransferase [Bacillota bacterium]